MANNFHQSSSLSGAVQRPWTGFLRRFGESGFQSLAQNRRGIHQLFREVRAAESKFAGKSESSIRSTADGIIAASENKGPTKHLSVSWAGLIAEAIFRTHGFRLHDVQVQAMVAGSGGAIVEMQTGEGKTVVTGATAAMKLLSSQSVHVGTTNTYLAARDLEDNTAMFDLLGIKSGLLPEDSNEHAIRRAYRNQIVYGPGYQYGFDYLRDQMNLRKNRQSRLGVGLANRIRGVDPYQNLVQVGDHNVALIDEADSVMIDEAMTPLIISVPGSDYEDPTPYQLAKKITADYREGIEYTLKMPEKKLELAEKTSQQAH